MERLGHCIQDAVDARTRKPLCFSRSGGPKLSHMFFADNLILVAEASSSQVNTVLSILEEFCSKSGQIVNLQKSQIVFSKNVREDLAINLSHDLDISITNDLGRYLGTPLIHQ